MTKKITFKRLGVDLKDPKAFSDTLWGQCLRFPEKTAHNKDLTELIQANVDLVNRYMATQFTMCLSRYQHETKEDPFSGLREQRDQCGWNWFPPLVAFLPPGFYILRYDPKEDKFSFAPVRDGPIRITEECVYLNGRNGADNQLRVSPWTGHTDGGSPYVGGLGNDRSYASQARNVHIFLGDDETSLGCSKLMPIIEEYGLEVVPCVSSHQNSQVSIMSDISRLAVRASKEGITINISQDPTSSREVIPAAYKGMQEPQMRRDLTREYALEVYHRFFVR